MVSPTLSPSVPAPAAPDRPRVLRRPLGFPVGDGAPGPVAVVVGDRLDVVRTAEVVQRLGAAGVLVRTGEATGLPRPATDGACEDVEVPTGHPGRVLGTLVAALADVFAAHGPSAVLVHGGGTAALAGALAANAAGLHVVHLGAGLRSHDRRQPEEHHRRVVDGLADLCCAPSATAVAALRAEGVADDRILLTGDPVVESLHRLLPDDATQDALAAELQLPAGYVLLTVDRPEHTGRPDLLAQLLGEVARLVEAGVPVVVPAAPSTAQRWREQGFGGVLDRCTVLGPLDPVQWTVVQHRAAVLVSDADGAAEEASVLKRPALLVRRATERPEVQGAFTTLVPGGLRLAAAVHRALAEDPARLRGVPSPYGDGSASRVVVESVVKLVAPF
ncbi:UDP-N-acetylglucosamine 2-epimerase [Kineococcus sp. DHX-1]|uniref:UDP-N-acetylglucosamine 2-epimerase n=1 Tax=Kineococcus sp. DHX-1 TaxID=3349638 RepID=UPI0036D30743